MEGNNSHSTGIGVSSSEMTASAAPAGTGTEEVLGVPTPRNTSITK